VATVLFPQALILLPLPQLLLLTPALLLDKVSKKDMLLIKLRAPSTDGLTHLIDMMPMNTILILTIFKLLDIKVTILIILTGINIMRLLILETLVKMPITTTVMIAITTTEIITLNIPHKLIKLFKLPLPRILLPNSVFN